MNKGLVLLGCFFGCNLSFAGCSKDCSGSKSVNISFETDGKTIKMDGVELSNKVDPNQVLNNKADALCYEISKETWDKLFTSLRLESNCTSCSKPSPNLFFVKCTNGKYYACYCSDCAYNTVSIFTNVVEVYFGVMNASSYVNLFNGCANLEAVYGKFDSHSFCQADDSQIKDMFKGCSKLKKISMVSTWSGSFEDYIGSLGLSYNLATKAFVK